MISRILLFEPSLNSLKVSDVRNRLRDYVFFIGRAELARNPVL